MTLPYRDFTQFDLASLEGNDPDDNAFGNQSDWTTKVFNYLKVGDKWDPYWKYRGLVRPKGDSWQLQTSLNEIIDVLIEAVVSVEENTAPTTTAYFQNWMFGEANPWVAGQVNGQFYDGENVWSNWPSPPTAIIYEQDQTQLTLANGPWNLEHWIWSWRGGVGMQANVNQDAIFRNGFFFVATTYAPALGVGESLILSALVNKIRVRYFNAIVNSISTNNQKLAGGDALVLTGLGFDNSQAELNENATPAIFTWTPDVDKIYFEKTEGSADYEILPGGGAGQFVIDSDTQITIDSMPAMADGVYFIRLRKVNVRTGDIPFVDSYAGDFSVVSSGLVSDASRLNYTASDTYGEDPPSQPIILTDWRWKNKAGDTALRSYSFIDAPSPDTFYDGRITNISSLKREVDDNTGLFSISDVSIDLANHDKEFSKLLAEYFLKNQIVDIYQHFANQPFAERTSIHKCIVDDYSLNGPIFSVLLKDITRKYFQVRVPRYRCTEAEFGDIHDSAIGKAMPEVLGLCSVTTGTAPGAVEAAYVDTANFVYLASRGSLYSVDEVYSDGTEMTEGAGDDYTIVYKDGGRTYIDFADDQGDNKITFNCKGYMYGDWNSANDYVQSPIYITAFLLAFIAEIPIELVDTDSFDTLQTTFIAEGWDTSGHLILQNETDLDEALKGLLFTCGNYGFVAMDGKFKIQRKNIEDYIDSTIRIYDQIDAMSSAKRNYNLRSAVNYIQSVYNFYPAPNQSFGSLEDSRESSIEDYEAEMEAGSPVSLPWTNSLALVTERITNMLLKRGYGDHRISFSLSIKWFKDLDLLTDFQYQDPFGLSTTGAGEVGRYYYIISLNYNWMAATIEVEAVDLEWLLRQYIIIGTEGVQAANWTGAPETDRIRFYAADDITGRFADGEPGKVT